MVDIDQVQFWDVLGDAAQQTEDWGKTLFKVHLNGSWLGLLKAHPVVALLATRVLVSLLVVLVPVSRVVVLLQQVVAVTAHVLVAIGVDIVVCGNRGVGGTRVTCCPGPRGM